MDCRPRGPNGPPSSLEPITITLPRIDPEAIAELERATISAGLNESAAADAILEAVGPLARWGQLVKAGEVVLMDQGKPVTGFVAVEYDVNPAKPARLYLSHHESLTFKYFWVCCGRDRFSHFVDPIAAGYSLADIVAGLARALEGLHARLPQKIAKAKERAALAADVVARIGALKGGGV